MNVSAISEYRTKLNMTQSQLAEKLFVSQQLISQWEKGLRRPDRNMLEAMAEIFSCKLEDLLPADRNILNELSECIPDNKYISAKALDGLLNGFLGTVSEKERVIFIKSYYFLLSSKETAAEMGIKDNHVRAVLSRTRKKLKKYLSEVVL